MDLKQLTKLAKQAEEFKLAMNHALARYNNLREELFDKFNVTHYLFVDHAHSLEFVECYGNEVKARIDLQNNFMYIELKYLADDTYEVATMDMVKRLQVQQNEYLARKHAN